MRIIGLELYKLNENLKNNDTEFKTLELEFDEKIKTFIYKHGIDEDFGARPLKRAIEKEISTPLANRLLEGDIAATSIVKVTAAKNKVNFDVEERQVEENKELMAVQAEA
jgi:ATP-dependent Clp protease ATP-binding subunit ClpA